MTLTINGIELDEFTVAYITAALWSTNDESDESGGIPLDNRFKITDINLDRLTEMVEDCRKFQADNMDNILTWNDGRTSPLKQAGHDFWFTRNGHGVGFWECEWGDPGQELDKAAKVAGEAYFGIEDIIASAVELSEEPEVTDNGKKMKIGEYLSQWGGDPIYDNPPRKRGDGYTFYNYDSEKNMVEYLEDCLLPAIQRNSLCQQEGLNGLISCLSDDDRKAFETITTYIKRRIELLKEKETDE